MQAQEEFARNEAGWRKLGDLYFEVHRLSLATGACLLGTFVVAAAAMNDFGWEVSPWFAVMTAGMTGLLLILCSRARRKWERATCPRCNALFAPRARYDGMVLPGCAACGANVIKVLSGARDAI